MKRKSKSVQSTLFVAFFAILFFTFFTYSIYYFISEGTDMRSHAYETIEQNVLTVSSFMDSEINSLDTVAQNIAYSNLVKEHFYSYLNMQPRNTQGNYDSMQNIKVLTDLLVSIIGPNRPVDQIYLYSTDKGCFGSGLDNSNSMLSVKDMEWYENISSPDVNKYIFCDKDSRLKKYFTYEEGSYFLTYCLKFNKSLFRDTDGIVEVKKSASNFIGTVDRLANSGYEESIIIFDEHGNLVYPLVESTEYINEFNEILSKDYIARDSGVNFCQYDGNKNVFYLTSDYSGFTTLVVVNNSAIMRPILTFIRANTLIFVLFLLISFGLSYIVSRIITDPIMKMYSQIQSYEMGSNNSNDTNFEAVNTNIIELDTLYSALIDMQKRNKLSMEHEIALHNQEMQSRMLALQSQMNPHFLYNSLATIQSMADENMNDEIVDMCQTISRILRYISSDKQLLVSIHEDLIHVKDYLQCMKIRYDDDLNYNIFVPEKMTDILIPKLCLQLIVENSIKYATKSVRPPWKVDITGVVTETYWEISIKDNGAGFSDEDIRTINEKIKYINETSLLPSLELNGMGLLNIYIRFKTLYKGNHIFKIGNLATGGAIVTIGGDVYRNGENHE